MEYKLVPKTINQNLEAFFYNYEFCAFPKEIKATLNYKLFNRTSPAVCVSEKLHRLFLNVTIDTSYAESSFITIPDAIIDSTAEHINYINNTMKKKGFDEIVFSLIPNPVSITGPSMGHYNKLIERIQNNPRLKAHFIDVNSVFKNYPQKDSLYRVSDSHWTCTGFNLWLDQMNNYLQRLDDNQTKK